MAALLGSTKVRQIQMRLLSWAVFDIDWPSIWDLVCEKSLRPTRK